MTSRDLLRKLRPRRSTWVLIVVYALVVVLYLQVRPPPVEVVAVIPDGTPVVVTPRPKAPTTPPTTSTTTRSTTTSPSETPTTAPTTAPPDSSTTTRTTPPTEPEPSGPTATTSGPTPT